MHIYPTGRQDTLTTGLAAASVHLFQNNHTPVDGDTVATFTEANFVGYAAAGAPSWGTPSTANPSVMSTTSGVTFTCSLSAQSVYGYYALDSGGNLLFADNLGYVLLTEGGTLTINMSISQTSS